MDARRDFPIFENNSGLVYLDSAATTQKPKVVVDSIERFYKESNANVHRGVYRLAKKSEPSSLTSTLHLPTL